MNNFFRSNWERHGTVFGRKLETFCERGDDNKIPREISRDFKGDFCFL